MLFRSSIIINNYNYGRFLGAAIDSALSQDYQRLEVIVVDDGSTDNSREIIYSYGSRIIPVLQENGGQASAFNTGFLASGGEVICLLDADDVFLPAKVEVVAAYFTANPGPGWLFHNLEHMDAGGRRSGKGLISKETGLVDLRSSISRHGRIFLPAPATSGLCFRRDLLKLILPMPGAIRITSDNYLKYASLTLSPGLYLNQVLALQRLHGANAYTGRVDLQARGSIHCQIAYYLALNIKNSRLFARKLMAVSLADLYCL